MVSFIYEHIHSGVGGFTPHGMPDHLEYFILFSFHHFPINTGDMFEGLKQPQDGQIKNELVI